ncbi:acyl-CoA dehydrogenase, partial [Nakamurella silvestris]
MNLQNPKKFKMLLDQAHETAVNVLRPISRKYDKAEHAYPKELDMLASLLDGMNDGGDGLNAGAAINKRGDHDKSNKNGTNMSTALGIIEMCYGDTGLLLSMPRQGLGNSAIAAVANDEQLERFKGTWAAMAITEPGCGSDSAAIRTTATQDGDEYILNGEKIFVTSGERADSVVVWATLDKKLGRAAIKSFVVPKGTPGMKVERLEHKLGIKASDTAAISFIDCRVPAANLLGNAEIDVAKGFAGVMETFDNTRPLVAAMAVGCAKASLERIKEIFKDELDADYATPYLQSSNLAAQIYRMEAEWEAA